MANPSTGAPVPANEKAVEAVAELAQFQAQIQARAETAVPQPAVTPHPALAALMQDVPATPADDDNVSDEAIDTAPDAPDGATADTLVELPPIEPAVTEQPSALAVTEEPTEDTETPEPDVAIAPLPPTRQAVPPGEQEILPIMDTAVAATDDGEAPHVTATMQQPAMPADDPSDAVTPRGAAVPPGIANARERSSGAPFQSRMPGTAQTAQPALNNAPPFATDIQAGQLAGSPDEAAPQSSDPDMGATAEAETLEPDVEEALDLAKRAIETNVNRDPNRIAQPGETRATSARSAAAAATPSQPIAAEGGFQPGLDGRGVAMQQVPEGLQIGAGSAIKQTAARSYGGNATQPATQQIAIGISRAMQEGADRLTVQLKPAAMGRISIELEVGHDNRVIAVIAAERADTFELLQRDSKALERALNDAGLKTDAGSLSFDLRGEGRERDSDDSAPQNIAGSIALPEDMPPEAAAAMKPYADGGAPGRLNIRI